MLGGGFDSSGSGGGFDYQEHNDEKSSSQLNLGNIIIVNLLILIKNAAGVESKLKYGGCPPATFTPFFTSFRELFDLTSHLIDPDISERINEWFNKVDVKNTKSFENDVKEGLKHSRTLKMEIVKLGMLKIFEDPINPPFMINSFLEELEKENETSVSPSPEKSQIKTPQLKSRTVQVKHPSPVIKGS